MALVKSGQTAEVDEVSRGILHCLQLDGRVSFRRAAEVLGVSEQTIARRYQQLRADGIVRVVGLVNPGPRVRTEWNLRLKTRPDHAAPLAAALAARDDISWVALCSGATEVLASLSTPDDARDDLLMSRLPSSARVLEMTASAVLHRFPPPPGQDFRVASSLVTTQAAASLATARPEPSGRAPALSVDDGPLLQLLATDGRASVAQLARATGWSESRTGLRLRSLLTSGRVYVDVDVALEPLGYRSSAHLWLVVEPRALASTGTSLAAHPGVAFVGAVTGTANLMVAALLPDPVALYRFVDEALGRLDGIRQVEVAPVLRWVKQAGTLMDGQRLRPN